MSPIKRCCRKDLQPLSPLARSRFHTRAVPHPYQVTPMGFLPAHGDDALTMEQVQLDGAVLHIKTFRQHKPAQEIGKKPQQPTLHLLWEPKSGNTVATTLIPPQCPEWGLCSFFKPPHQHPFLFWFNVLPCSTGAEPSPSRAVIFWHREACECDRTWGSHLPGAAHFLP